MGLSEKLNIFADSTFSFWAIEPNKNAESAGFLEKVNPRQEKTRKATSFAMKSIRKLFNFEKLVNVWGRRVFLKHRKWLTLESWKMCYSGRKTSMSYAYRFLKSVRSLCLIKIFETDWKTMNFHEITRFYSELYSQNENTELAKFLEKVNPGQEKARRATSFAMKPIAKLLNFEKLVKVWERRAFLKHWKWSSKESWKLSCFGRNKS